MIQALRSINIGELEPKQLKNVVGFLKTVDDDEQTAYLLTIIDNESKEGFEYDLSDQKMIDFLLEFRDVMVKMDVIADREDVKK